MPFGSTIEQLVAGPDGGAWFSVSTLREDRNAIGRVTPDGRFTTTAVRGPVADGALGPDGQAWFRGGRRELIRSDAAGAVTLVAIRATVSGPLATGPDGTLWAQAGERMAHISPQGDATFNPFEVDECFIGSGLLMALARASDGAMWASDQFCERLFRITDAGTTIAPAIDLRPEEMAADATGGMWFAGAGDSGVGHATAAGAVTRYRLPKLGGFDVAVAPDGSAWFATGTCTLARISPADHAISTTASPIPARRLAFDAAGALLLASPARLVRHTPGTPAGACDDRPPALRLSPGRDDGTVNIRALRRAGGVRMTVREPAALAAIASLDGPDGPIIDERLATPIIRGRKGGTGRYRFPASQLRRIERDVAAGKRGPSTCSPRRSTPRATARSRPSTPESPPRALRGRSARARRRRPRGGRCGRRGRTRPAPPARTWPRSGARRSAPRSRARGRSAAAAGSPRRAER